MDWRGECRSVVEIGKFRCSCGNGSWGLEIVVGVALRPGWSGYGGLRALRALAAFVRSWGRRDCGRAQRAQPRLECV